MGNLTVKNRTLTTSYEYENETVKVNGSYNRNADSDGISNINGNVVLKADESPIGNFYGYKNGERHTYNQSDVPFEHLAVFMAAVQEIDNAINSSSSSEGGEA